MPDHEAAVFFQSKVTAKMNDTIIANNEGDAQQQNNQLQNVNGSNSKPRALLLCQPNSHPFQVYNILSLQLFLTFKDHIYKINEA